MNQIDRIKNSSQFSATLFISVPSPYNRTNPTLCAETEDYTIFTALLLNSIITKSINLHYWSQNVY